ncbi:N-acetyltransferase family protein [bacterium]|nr:MAG: N-acetyltransferase family protein [bacterium]
MQIRDAISADGDALAAIYNPYIADSIVTFEETPIVAQDMRDRVAEVQRAGMPWLVLEEGGRVRGYAYATTWRTRIAYRHCCEISVYLDEAQSGRGYGTALYAQLFERLLATDLHVILGCISLPNDASVALHEKFGLTKVAHFSEVGFKFGRWIDVGYWQRTL